ncbi:MAG: carboxypeptidase regulatory-like domain-containing protein, partial [Myxococcales bacterium]|nr:carboxypeptidase regulatory-like domain-containing protein [Myxococcales bacterium]
QQTPTTPGTDPEPDYGDRDPLDDDDDGTTGTRPTRNPPPPPAPTPQPPAPGADPTGALDGTVCIIDPSNIVSGGRVEVQHAGGVAYAVTDGNGYFYLDGLFPGQATVTLRTGSFSTVLDVTIYDGMDSHLAYDSCIPQGDVEIMVVGGEYDDIGAILSTDGFTYDYIDGTLPGVASNFLLNSAQMAQYDIIFFNCGFRDEWMSSQAAVTANLRNYVAAGGSVYASDWAYYLVEASFPSQNTFVGNDAVAGDAKVGQEQIINASVIDAGMRQLVGPTATIDMALEDWAALQSTTSTVLVQGTFTAYNPQGWNYPDLTITAPLATEFTYSQGKVVYTAFHNEGQNTFDMDALLKKIVLSL